MKGFVIDVGICNGCYNCQIACKDEHVGNDWSPIAKPQPDTGQFWMKLNEYVHGTVPKVKMHYLPMPCFHCDEAPCISQCPIKGAIYKREDGLVIIDPEKCTGCKNCTHSCPWSRIYFNDSLNIAQKCSGCAHLLDRGWKEPRCVDACPTQALKFGEIESLKDLIAKAGVLNPELGVHTRCYYLNIPGKFVAGTVYDPINKEVVIKARCTLIGPGPEKKEIVNTDEFGDFWFPGLSEGNYSLTIEAEGFTTWKTNPINVNEDVNLGDIALSR